MKRTALALALGVWSSSALAQAGSTYTTSPQSEGMRTSTQTPCFEIYRPQSQWHAVSEILLNKCTGETWEALFETYPKTKEYPKGGVVTVWHPMVFGPPTIPVQRE